MREAEFEMMRLRTESAKQNSRLRAEDQLQGQCKQATALISARQSDDEAELHGQITGFCRASGWLAFHGSMAHRSWRSTGEPDFIIVTDDKRVLFIECKTKTGKLSQAQLAVQAHLHKLGQEYHVVRSMDDFMKVVRHGL